MKKSVRALLVLLGLVALLSPSFAMSESESLAIEKILTRLPVVLERTVDVEPDRIAELLEGLDENGQWGDIDYGDQKRGQWAPWDHAKRLRELSLALVQDLPEIPEPERVENAIIRALDHWLESRYQSRNWWHNQIGVPREMRDVAIVLRDRLDEKRRQGILEVIGQHKMRGAGANLLWSAELALHYGCLTRDPEIVGEAARRIRDEITVGGREGIQDDWSFRQHGPRLMQFAYGRSFANVAIVTAWQLRDTPWEFANEEIAILSTYLLEGTQWMQRRNYTVPSTMDRSASRPGSLRVDLADPLELWAEVDSERRQELETFRQRLLGRHAALNGFRHFPQADFTTYHRPGFSFFVKTLSDRTLPTESINNENLLGHHFHSGDHYLVRTGHEYFDLMPVWDWGKLPGLTQAPGAGEIDRRPFVGALGDESAGLAVMDVRTSGESEVELKARRSWFFVEDFVVALVGGWEVSASGEHEGHPAPHTVLDQSRLLGKVAVVDRDGAIQSVAEGEHPFDRPLAILHGDVAWLPLGRPSVTVRAGPAKGSWERINANHSGEPVVEPVFLAWMDHGAKPRSGGFVVAPGVDAEEARQLATEPPWTVLRNSRRVQAIAFGDSVAMAALFEPGEVELGGESFSSSAPCLAFSRGENLLLSDPTGEGRSAKVAWRGATREIELPAGGAAAKWEE